MLGVPVDLDEAGFDDDPDLVEADVVDGTGLGDEEDVDPGAGDFDLCALNNARILTHLCHQMVLAYSSCQQVCSSCQQICSSCQQILRFCQQVLCPGIPLEQRNGVWEH